MAEQDVPRKEMPGSASSTGVIARFQPKTTIVTPSPPCSLGAGMNRFA
jgi:hypothetical protein